MKQIKNILVIAILVIFAVACTDEDQSVNDTKVNNRKTLYSIYDQRDHTYEDTNYTEDEMFAMMQKFDSLMRGQGSASEYDIEEALFAMEFYYNYAVVDKQEDYDTTSYDGQTFSFNVDLNSNGNIDVDILRENYTTFLNYVLTAMGNKYLQYSDLYVIEKTSNSITFGLEILPYSSNYRFRKSIIKENPPTDIVTIGSESTNWNYLSNGQTDEMVRSLCKKQVNNCFFYIINTFVPFDSNLLPNGTFNIYTTSVSSGLYFSYFLDRLRDLLVYPTIAMANTYMNVGNRKPIDVMPTVYFGLDPVTGKLSTAYMSMKEMQNAQILYLTAPNLFNTFVTNHLIFPIQ